MRIGAFVLTLAGLCGAWESAAQTPGEIRLYEDNDFFNPFTERTDRFYTQGLRVEWLSPMRHSSDEFLPTVRLADWCSLLCGDGAEQGNLNTGYAIGQNIYTPTNTAVSARQPYDHPWGGWLYGSRIARVSYAAPKLKAQRQDRIEVSLGIVGPPSLAREAQSRWHDVIRVARPQGWDNQLKTEPVFQLRYDTTLRWPRAEGGNADILPHVRINMGNANTSVEADITGRIGWNLKGFGVQPIPLAATASARSSALSAPRWLASGNVFVRAGGKAVARNMFLDGNSFAHNDIRLDHTTFVGEIGAGAELNLVGPFWITAQFIHRGSEFVSWRGRKGAAQEYGAITLAWMLD